MGWRDSQRKHRKHFQVEQWGARLREAWNHLDAQEQIDFLAELEEKRHDGYAGANVLLAYEDEAVGVDWSAPPLPEPEPDNPVYNAAVARHGGDPLGRSLYSHTQLLRVYEPQSGELR